MFWRNGLRVGEIIMGERKRQGQCAVWSNVFVFFDAEDGVPVFVGVRRFHVKYVYSQVERSISVVS